jgi:type 1 glutamine amidotransferase
MNSITTHHRRNQRVEAEAGGPGRVALQVGLARPRWIQSGIGSGPLHTALLILVGLWTGLAQSAPVPSPAEVQKIMEAVPGVSTVQPLQPRKVLVFSRAWGYRHSAIPYGKKALELMAKKTGAFAVVISDDDRYFEKEVLEEFDAVVFNNTNNEIFLPEKMDELPPVAQSRAREKDARLKKNFREFLAAGKGLVVWHAGVASFRQWPEFGNIMGARFDNHPWNAGSRVTLKVEDTDHSLCGAFDHALFEITDEIYQFKGGYTRKNLRVLLSLDTDRTNMEKGSILHRKDHDYALSWVKPYQKGRVFYGALGHQHDIVWNPTVLRY